MFASGDSSTTAGSGDQITDWGSDDRLDLVTAGTVSNYVEASAADYEAALALATTQIAGNVTNHVAVSVGGSYVVLFSDNSAGGTGTTVTDAVILTGKTLAAIDFGNIV